MKDETRKTTAITTKEEANVPDYIEQNAKGTEVLESKDVVIPRLKLVQSMSDERVELGIPEGHYVNSITKKDYGNTVNISVLLATSGWIMFDGKGKDAKVISRKFKGDLIPPLNEEVVLNPENQRWNGDTPPKATQCYTYIVVINGKDDMLSFSLMKTGIKTAKQLNTMLMMRNIPAYATRFVLTSELVKGDKGTYYVARISPAGYNDKEIYISLAKKYESLITKNIEIGIEDDEIIKEDDSKIDF